MASLKLGRAEARESPGGLTETGMLFIRLGETATSRRCGSRQLRRIVFRDFHKLGPAPGTWLTPRTASSPLAGAPRAAPRPPRAAYLSAAQPRAASGGAAGARARSQGAAGSRASPLPWAAPHTWAASGGSRAAARPAALCPS